MISMFYAHSLSGGSPSSYTECLLARSVCPADFPDAISDTTMGTTPWHPLRLSFSTGPQTRAVRLSFWRPRSRVFPMEISGTCWLDVVSLECLGPEQSEAKIVKGKGKG